MKSALTILLILVMAADAVVLFQMRRLIKSWEKEVEKEDQPLTEAEQRYMEVRVRLLGILSTAALVIFVLRFLAFELLPLIRG